MDIMIIILFFSRLIPDLILEWDIEKLEFKPLNCPKCLGFWISMITIPFVGIYQGILITAVVYIANKIMNMYSV